MCQNSEHVTLKMLLKYNCVVSQGHGRGRHQSACECEATVTPPYGLSRTSSVATMSQNSAVGRSIIARTFKEFENVKPILSSRAIQKEAAGWIWPAGHSLPTPDLDLFLLFW